MNSEQQKSSFTTSEDLYWRLCTNDFFYLNYLYKSLHVLNHFEEELETAYKGIKIFEKYNSSDEDEKDYFQVRQIISALYNSCFNIKTTFPIDKLSVEEIKEAGKLIYFCQKHTFYPWDIKNIPNPISLLDFIDKNEHLPIMPPVFNCSEKTEDMFNNRFFLLEKSDFIFSDTFEKEMFKFYNSCLVSLEDYSSDEFKKSTKLYMNFFSDKIVNPKKLEVIAKLFKKRIKYPYQGKRSIWERLIGLSLWLTRCDLVEKKISKNCYVLSIEEKERIYKSIKSSELISSLSKIETFEKFLADEQHPVYKVLSERNAQRWLAATEESIKQGDYATIK